MKLFASLLLVAVSFTAPSFAGPIRVLYLGKEGTPSSAHCAALMEELGRDAIWFDYSSDASAVTREWIGKFDAVLLDAPAENFRALSLNDSERLVKPVFGATPKSWKEADFINTVREQLLNAAGGVRRAEWEGFLAQREPEVREPNANVANYEKRPAPITFQHPMSVAASMQRTQVPVDMRLELFASEPDIAKPIAFAWDARGRLWVAETRDYPHGVEASGEGHDDIKICEDADGDGKADKFTVFADHLNLPTSLVFANGGVIVSQPPRFLFLKDTNGDDRADVREVLIDGWGVQDTHAQASNLHYGFDNWIHGCVGYSGFKGEVGGVMQDFKMGTYRFTRDGQHLEFLHQFSNNAWGQSFNRAGDDFGGTANNAPIFYGGIPARVVPPGIRSMTAKKINIEDKAHAITPNYRQVDVFGGYTAAAGSSFIESSKLPPRLQGMAMVCEPTMKLISLMDVQRNGAGYVAKDGFNLVASSDEWMSPVFAEVGPDGAVWFADWQNFIIQHNPTPSLQRGGYEAKTGAGGAHENPLRDHARGRIYRVVWDRAPQPAKLAQIGARTDELIKALGSDTQERRLTAQRLLVEGQKTDASAALTKMVASNDGQISAVHALWALQGLGQLDEATLKAALAAKDPVLRRNAIRALGNGPQVAALLAGTPLLSDSDPVTRLAAMVKLAELPTTPEIQTSVKRLITDAEVKKDEWLAAATMILEKKHKVEAYKEGPNLLPNPGFEIVGDDGMPKGWTRRDYGAKPGNESANWSIVDGDGSVHSGTKAVRVVTRADGDTSLHADVAIKPHTQYRLSGWVKTHAFRGKVSLNDHVGRAETDKIVKDSGWVEVERVFDSGDRTTASINLLHVANGDSYFDDVKLVELIPIEDEKLLPGDAKRGELVFFKHQTVSCVLCHMLHGQGSTVGPALDGIAARATPEYIKESLLEPNKVLAKGYENLGASPMPPMGLVLKPQEIEDVQAFLQTLK